MEDAVPAGRADSQDVLTSPGFVAREVEGIKRWLLMTYSQS
jgi:hypothetical protein